MYDWANSAFWVTVIVAVFPPFFSEYAAKGLAPQDATQRFAWGTTIAVTIVAIIAPILGTIADQRAMKKRLLGVFLIIGAAATLLMGTIATHSIQQSLLATLPYDPVKDFMPIVQVASQAYVAVVRTEFTANSLAELTAMAKQNPRKINYASAAKGTEGHLFAELYRARAGIDVAIQYKGSTPAMNDVLGGHVPFTFDVILTTMPHIRSGKLRPLAVTSARRSPLLPEVPTVAEQGFPGYDAVGWNGLYAPAKTPQAIVERLNREVNAVLALPEVRDRVASLGASVVGGTPEQFAQFMHDEATKWGRLIRDHKIAAD